MRLFELRIHFFYKISTYIESGAMGRLIHDKGERAGLGRLLEVIDSNNHNYKLDPSWHKGTISVRIDADGVNSNDNDIVTNIIKTKEYIAADLLNGHSIKITSLLNNHVGGGGTMKSFTDAI